MSRWFCSGSGFRLKNHVKPHTGYAAAVTHFKFFFTLFHNRHPPNVTPHFKCFHSASCLDPGFHLLFVLVIKVNFSFKLGFRCICRHLQQEFKYKCWLIVQKSGVFNSVRKKKLFGIQYDWYTKNALMKNKQIQPNDILCNISNFILDRHHRKGL